VAITLLYKQKQKQFCFHFCWPPTDKLSPSKMDFIFVDFPAGQQKWISFLLVFLLVNKNENNFEDSMT
jgi:hypothetical protein